jgi:hypothetical protein
MLNVHSADGFVQIQVRNNGGPYSSGAVYWDGGAQKFKVIDSNGGSQDMYLPMIEIGATGLTQSAINWVMRKQHEEMKLDELCKQYPTLADARREFEMLLNLVKDR